MIVEPDHPPPFGDRLPQGTNGLMGWLGSEHENLTDLSWEQQWSKLSIARSSIASANPFPTCFRFFL
jgi:hypothetical protein